MTKNIPIWAYRIWRERSHTGIALNTFDKEGPKLWGVITDFSEEAEITPQLAEQIVAFAWGNFAEDSNVHDDKTKFPLSSFIATGRGQIVDAYDQRKSSQFVRFVDRWF